MNINQIGTNQSQPPLMRPQYQQQLRCYLCEIPKQDYSLTRSFSEIICRACLNYEGSERVEQLIAEARRTKGSAGVSPASSMHSHHANEHNTHPQQQQQHQNHTSQETIDQTEVAAKQTNGIDVANIQLPAALRNCYYLSSGSGSNSNDTTTKTDNPVRPERPPSVIDVESLSAGSASQQRHQRYEPEFSSSNAGQQSPVTNQMKRSLTRSSSPTIVLDTSSHAQEHHQQKHRGETRANLERQQRDQAAAAQLAVRAKSAAAPKTCSQEGARQLATKLDYCPQSSNESLIDNERALNKSFGFVSAATSPSLQQQQQQLHGFASRNITPSPVGHSLQERNNQQVAAQSARHQAKINDYVAHQQQTMHSYPGMMRAALPSDQQQQQQSHREATNHEHMSRYQSSAAAIAAAAAATAAYYKQIDGLGACVHDPEGLHRLMQECNVYAPGVACSRSGAPFYMRPQHIPTTNGAAQTRSFQSLDGNRLMVTTTTANDHKQQHQQQIQQASPTSLYGQYIPMTMTSYMTPNGPILCPSQYGALPPPPPYHPQQLMRPAMIRPPGTAQYITSNSGVAPPIYNPVSATLDKRQPPVSQQVAVTGCNEPFDQDNHLRNLLTTTTTTSQQPVDYNPSLSMTRNSTSNPSDQQRRVRSSTPSLDMTSSFGDAKQSRANSKSTTASANSLSESPANDLDKPSLGNSAACPLNVSVEDTGSGQLLQILDSGGGGGDGCDTPQHSETASQKSSSSKSQQESIKQLQQQQDDERRRRGQVTPRKTPPSSPGPQPKRLALGFSPSKSMMSYETGKEPRAPVAASQQSAAPIAGAPTKQNMTRRSHGHSEHERGGSGSRSPSSHGSDKVDSSHQHQQQQSHAAAAAAASHNGAEENSASPKPTRATATTTTTSRSGCADYNLHSNTNGLTGSGGKDHASYQIRPPGVKTTTKPYQNGTQDPPPPPPSGRGGGGGGGCTRSSDSTRDNASLSSRKTKSSHHHTSSSSASPAGTSSSTSAARSQPTSTPTGNTTHYNPLKCMSCKERLEDRHFVQCPSVVAHKFCFGCSKISIERQQAENKNLKCGLERIFCPSGKRCHLANEHTPWTFMNSEIETIIRESSRQSSSSAAAAAIGPGQHANKLNGVSGSGGGAVGDYQVSKQRQQQQQPTSQQNGHSKQNDLAKIS